MVREKIKTCYVFGDDDGSANSIEPPFPSSRHEKWKQTHLTKSRTWNFEESQWITERIISKCVSIL